MKVSIIILNWNGGVDNCIEVVSSAYEQFYVDKEIIFVDNASSDGSDKVIIENFPEIIYVQTGVNLGCPGGRNYGASFASGDLIFFLENDGVWKTNDVVSEAVGFMSKHPDVGVIYTAVEGYEYGVLDPPLDVHGQHTISLSSSFRGGASVIRRHLFEELGGFPGDYFRQYEERYLSFLIYDEGYTVVYWPKKVLRHKGSDYKGKSLQVSRYNFKNEMKTIIRIMPWLTLLRLLPLKLTINAFRFFSSRDFKWFFLEIIKLPQEFIIRYGARKITIKTYTYINNIRYGDIVAVAE